MGAISVRINVGDGGSDAIVLAEATLAATRRLIDGFASGVGVSIRLGTLTHWTQDARVTLCGQDIVGVRGAVEVAETTIDWVFPRLDAGKIDCGRCRAAMVEWGWLL